MEEMGVTKYDKDPDRTKKNQRHGMIWKINSMKKVRNRRKKDRKATRREEEKRAGW